MKTTEINSSPEEIGIPVWWSNGSGMMFNRDGLPPDHPGSTYRYIKETLKLRPEDYGVFRPNVYDHGEFCDCGCSDIGWGT